MSGNRGDIDKFLEAAPKERALYNDLTNLYQKLNQFFRQKWDRSLPFGDAVGDRWQRAKALNFGEGASIYDSAVVLGNVTVGKHTWIGPFVVLDGSAGLNIGSHCSISAGVQIYSHDSVNWAVTGGQAPYEKSPTSIGDNCYVGPNTIIARGVTIGDGCVIGANSLVLENIPAGSKAYGTPARIAGSFNK